MAPAKKKTVTFQSDDCDEDEEDYVEEMASNDEDEEIH
jgi:hypothetical protein